VSKGGEGNLFMPILLDGGIDLGRILQAVTPLDMVHNRRGLPRLFFEVDAAIYGLLRRRRTDNESGSRINFVLSHAGEYGASLANAFSAYVRDYLHSGTRSVYCLHTREAELDDAVMVADAVVIFRTDEYGADVEGRRFALLAKRAGLPIVVLDAFAGGETRASPYLGGTPSMRYDHGHQQDEQWLRLAGLALQEALHGAYFRRNLRLLQSSLRAPENAHPLPREPEVTSCLDIFSRTVIYPDPPIADDEIDVLHHVFGEKIAFITPTQLPHMQRRSSP
jgi:hypothetical protein